MGRDHTVEGVIVQIGNGFADRGKALFQRVADNVLAQIGQSLRDIADLGMLPVEDRVQHLDLFRQSPFVDVWHNEYMRDFPFLHQYTYVPFCVLLQR